MDRPAAHGLGRIDPAHFRGISSDLHHQSRRAFGILAYQRWFFLAIVILLFGAFFFFRKRIPKEPRYFSVAIGMLLGGALGNAIDRVRISGVVDFFDFRIWPIFNVADIFICVGVALIVFYFWRHEA